MTSGDSGPPSRAEILGRVRALVPAIGARAAAAERLRRVPERS